LGFHTKAYFSQVIRQELADNESRRKDLVKEYRETQGQLKKDFATKLHALALHHKRENARAAGGGGVAKLAPPPKGALPRELANLGVAARAPVETVKEVFYAMAPPDVDVSEDSASEDEEEELGKKGRGERERARAASAARRTVRESRREGLRAKERAEEALLDAIRDRSLEALEQAIAEVSLSKIVFYFKASMWESIILVFPPPPTCKAYSIAILLRDHCAIYAPPPTPSLHARHHTILVMAISCKGHRGGTLRLAFTRDLFSPKLSCTSQSCLYCPLHLHCSRYCNTITRLMRSMRPPTLPSVCMPYTIQYWQWQYLVRVKYS